MKRCAALLLALATPLHAEVKFEVSRVSDERIDTRYPGNLRVNIKATGPELAGHSGLRLALQSATDNTGKNLVLRERRAVGISNDGPEFADAKTLATIGPDRAPDSLVLTIANPERTATTIRIAGQLEMLAPAKDPKNSIIANLANQKGKPLANAALKAAGVQIAFSPMEGNKITFELTDPNEKVASIEFCAPDGKVLATNSWSSSGFGEAKSNRVTLEAKPPAGVTARIQLAGPKSIVRFPFAFDAIPLP